MVNSCIFVLSIRQNLKNIIMKVGTHTSVTINKGAIFSQTNLYLKNNEVVKSNKVTYFSIDNRSKMIDAIVRLEQCNITVNNTKRVLNSILKALSNNNIEYKILSQRFPFEDNYTETEIEFIQ